MLPQAAEAPHLALQVAGGLPVALEAARPPVDLVHLGQPVHELGADRAALAGLVEPRRNVRGHNHAVHLLHHVEGDAEDGGVVAGRQHGRHADRSALKRLQEARLAQHVVGRGRQRWARWAAQHPARAAAADEEVEVGVALSDPLGLQAPLPDAVGVEKGLQRLAHDQRPGLEARGLRCGVDHVGRAHGPKILRRPHRWAVRGV